MNLANLPITPPPEKGGNSFSFLKDEYTEYAPKSRHGHGQDVVNENNIRQVAGCIPIDVKNQRILLISSRKHKDAWVVVRIVRYQDSLFLTL
jgi:diphosphoinositol-polyphosphate diphosphatase